MRFAIFEEFVDIFLAGLIPLFIILLVIAALFGFYYCGTITEVKVWNNHYGTHYTAWEFFCAEDTIKSYINKGENKTINLNIGE